VELWTEYTLFATIGRMASELDYLQRIRAASVYDVAIVSPLELASNLSKRLDNQVWLKREDLQPVFSFKLRGAYNKIYHLSEEQRSRGVVAASAGNHAQGVALAGRQLGVTTTIVMPVTTPGIKVETVRRLELELAAEELLVAQREVRAARIAAPVEHRIGAIDRAVARTHPMRVEVLDLDAETHAVADLHMHGRLETQIVCAQHRNF